LESKIVGACIGYLTHLPDNARPRKEEVRWEVTRYNVEDEYEDDDEDERTHEYEYDDEHEKKNDDDNSKR
jgi:hypothetical protein